MADDETREPGTLLHFPPPDDVRDRPPLLPDTASLFSDPETDDTDTIPDPGILLPDIPAPPDPAGFLNSAGIGDADTGTDIDTVSGDGSADGEAAEFDSYQPARSLSDRLGDWIEHRVNRARDLHATEQPYRQAEVARKVALLQARTAHEKGVIEQNGKLRQAQLKASGDLAAARGKAGAAGAGGSKGGKPSSGSPSGGLGSVSKGRGGTGGSGSGPQRQQKQQQKPTSGGSNGRGTGGGSGTGPAAKKRDDGKAKNQPRTQREKDAAKTNERQARKDQPRTPKDPGGKTSGRGGKNGAKQPGGGRGNGGSKGGGGGAGPKGDSSSRRRNDRTDNPRKNDRAAVDKPGPRINLRKNDKPKTDKTVPDVKRDKAGERRSDGGAGPRVNLTKDQPRRKPSDGTPTGSQKKAADGTSERPWRARAGDRPNDARKAADGQRKTRDKDTRGRRHKDRKKRGKDDDFTWTAGPEDLRTPRGEHRNSHRYTSDHSSNRSQERPKPGGPVSAESVGITVERDDQPRQRPDGPRGISPAPRSLGAAPEPHSPRPGTSRPNPDQPRTPPGEPVTSNSPRQDGDINYGSYLTAMANIAVQTQQDTSGLTGLIAYLPKAVDELRAMADVLADEHNIDRRLTSRISDLADRSDEARSRFGPDAQHCHDALASVLTAAKAVADAYRPDLDAMEEAGLTEASTAAHHD